MGEYLRQDEAAKMRVMSKKGAIGPYGADLLLAAEQLYDAFGRDHVSGDLEVCHCPVCMSEETRAKIIATRNDALPVELVADAEKVDDLLVDTGLLRFGDATRQHWDLFDATQRAALDNWARLMILHIAWVAYQGASGSGPFCVTEVLLAGGWPFAVVTTALEDAFADPQIGSTSLHAFAGAVMTGRSGTSSRVKVDW